MCWRTVGILKGGLFFYRPENTAGLGPEGCILVHTVAVEVVVCAITLRTTRGHSWPAVMQCLHSMCHFVAWDLGASKY